MLRPYFHLLRGTNATRVVPQQQCIHVERRATLGIERAAASGHSMRTKQGRLAFLTGLALIISCSVGTLFDAPPSKVIGVTPSRVVESAPAGSGATQSATLVLSTARGNAPPPWTAHRAANAPGPTIAAATDSARPPDTLRVALNPTGLAHGVYRDTIVIVPQDPSIAQLHVPVELQILPAARSLTFSAQPTTTTAGATFTPAVELTALDTDGQPFTGFSGTITIALGDHPAGAALAGTLSASANGGLARLPDIRLNKTGSYTVTATAPGLTAATSAAFDITPGAATQLRFTVQPTTTAQNPPITPAVEVARVEAGAPVTPGRTAKRDRSSARAAGVSP